MGKLKSWTSSQFSPKHSDFAESMWTFQEWVEHLQITSKIWTIYIFAWCNLLILGSASLTSYLWAHHVVATLLVHSLKNTLTKSMVYYYEYRLSNQRTTCAISTLSNHWF